jgi:Leucine-rich repeat (LRR) protein
MPVISVRNCGLFFAFLLFSGCSPEVKSPAVSPPVAKAETNAIAALKAAGAVVRTDDSGSATDLDLHKLTLTPEMLGLLPELKSLRALNLSDSSFSDESLPALEGVSPLLVNLDLRGCQLSDKAVSTVARFTNLRALRFNGKNGLTSIGDDGVKALAACKSLKVLALDELTFVGTDGLSALSGLTQLEELYLAGTVVDDDSCKLIAKFPKLKKLRLARNQVGDAGLDALSACSKLEELDLSEDALLTDAGMAHIAKLTALKKLNLWRVQITDDGALKLAPLTKLEWLNLDNTKLSDGGLAVLKEMKSLTFLHLGSTQITAAGAPDLFHLTSLKHLKITRTALAASDTAVAELKLHLKDTSIQTEYVENE